MVRHMLCSPIARFTCPDLDYDPSCIRPLQTCLIDFYKDLIQRFKQHLECLGTSTTVHDVFERTLNETLSINLRQLHRYMEHSSLSNAD